MKLGAGAAPAIMATATATLLAMAAAGCGGKDAAAGSDSAVPIDDGGAGPGGDGSDAPAGPDGAAGTGGGDDAPVAADGGLDRAGDAPSASDGGVIGSPRLCSETGWCWVHPLPTGNDLNTVLVRSGSDVWTAGTEGTLLHWDGAAWSQFHVATGYLYGLGAEPSSGAIWVVGEGGQAARFQAGAFTRTDTGTDVTLRAVWAAADDRVYAVGDGGTVLLWDGAHWAPVPPLMNDTRVETRDLRSIWGTTVAGADGGSDIEMWIGGSGGALWHLAGGTFNPVANNGDTWTAIAGSGPSNVWFTTGGPVYRWNGTALSVARASQVQSPNGVFVGADNDVWVTRYLTIEHWDGMAWSPISLASNLVWLSGSAANEVWGVGNDGAVMRWNGRTWTSPWPNTLRYGALALWAGGPNDVWMASQRFLYHWDGQTVTAATSPGTGDINAIWGTGANNVWTAGKNGQVQHWDGTRWTLAAATGTDEFMAISGSAPNDVWVVGFYSAYHFDGTIWSLRNTGLDAASGVSSVYAASPTRAWAGGFLDTLMVWDGTRWSHDMGVPTSSNQGGIQCIAGSGPNDVWAFGEKPYHYDGQTWRAVEGGKIAQSAWAPRAGDLWGVSPGYVFHYDGTNWTDVPPDVSLPMVIWGAGNDVWLGSFSGLQRRARTP
jgi:hypothetical protein